jgi:hypothetical protein
MRATLLALAGCHERAFAREGFVLVPTAIEHRLLVRKSGEPFTVAMGRTNALA